MELKPGMVVLHRFEGTEELVFVLGVQNKEKYIGIELEYTETVEMSPSFLHIKNVKQVVLDNLNDFLHASNDTGATIFKAYEAKNEDV